MRGENISYWPGGKDHLPHSQNHLTANYNNFIYVSVMLHLWICFCTFHQLATCLIAACFLLYISRDLLVVFLWNCLAALSIKEFWSVGCVPSMLCGCLRYWQRTPSLKEHSHRVRLLLFCFFFLDTESKGERKKKPTDALNHRETRVHTWCDGASSNRPRGVC